MEDFDCLRCGACCRNPIENVREGFTEYVEVAAGDAILRKPDLTRRFVVPNAAGVPHLRLDVEGRCLALRGRIGRRVRCAIYSDRPRPCRCVQPGSDLCRRYRAALPEDHGRPA